MLRYWDTIYEAFFTMSALRLSLPLPINHSNPKLKTLDANIAPAKDRRTSTPLPHVIWGMQRKIVVSADLLICGTFRRQWSNSASIAGHSMAWLSKLLWCMQSHVTGISQRLDFLRIRKNGAKTQDHSKSAKNLTQHKPRIKHTGDRINIRKPREPYLKDHGT